MGSFDDPAVRGEPGFGFDRFLFFAAGADVGGEVVLGAEVSHLGVVVALVEAETVGMGGGGVRPRDHDACERRAEELEVVGVRSRDLEPDRDAAAFADNRPLRPFFALSVGFGPVASPPSGAFPISPSHDSHSQLIPFNPS